MIEELTGKIDEQRFKERKSNMLYIFYGEKDNVINRSDVYFNNTYQDEWLMDDFVKSIISDVDKSEVLGPHLIESSVLGPIGPKDLSGGTKTLILMYKDREHIFNATNCGNNCSKWILEIAKKQDLTICLQHNMDFGTDGFEAIVLNNNRHIYNMRDLLDAIFDLEYGE